MQLRWGSIVAIVVLGLLGPPGAHAAHAQSAESPVADPMGASVWSGVYTDVQPPFPVFQPGDRRAEAMGVTSEGVLEATDPRISGRWRQVMNMWEYENREPGSPSAMVWSASVRIDNEEGAWVGAFTGFMDGGTAREWNILHGEGAYEGLTAVFRWLPEDSMQEGVIVPGDLPPLPDPIEP